jgi:hypothetical protein
MNQLTYAELGKKAPFRMFKIERPVLKGGNDLRAKREHFEAFSTGRVRNRADKYFSLALFFSNGAGKNPTQSYCQCTVRLVPSVKSG